MTLFYLAGGSALVQRALAETRTELASLIGPRVVVRTRQFGFTTLGSLSQTVLDRAPSPKLRMAVLKRDDFRCRICGRTSADHVDVQLHVHHIRPWGRGGVTVEENLLTLCHTCHVGLDPHYEPRLHTLVDEPLTATREAGIERYKQALLCYRAATIAGLQQARLRKRRQIRMLSSNGHVQLSARNTTNVPRGKRKR